LQKGLTEAASALGLCAQVSDPYAILEMPCDVLIPAALEGQLHSRNAGRIKVRLWTQGEGVHETQGLQEGEDQMYSRTRDKAKARGAPVENSWSLVSCFQARIVAEAANGPVTPPAEEIMEKNGIVLLRICCSTR